MSARIKRHQDRLAAVTKKIRELNDKAEAEGRDLNATESQEVESLRAEAKIASGALEREKELQAFELALGSKPDGNADTAEELAARGGRPKGLPKTFKRTGKLRYFKGENAELHAYASGMFFLANLWDRKENALSRKAAAWCEGNGELLAATATDNSASGVLIPDLTLNVIIDLMETYGVFRQNASIWPIGGGENVVPRRTGGLTAYFVNDKQAATDSQLGWDAVKLVAKEVAALTKYPKSVDEDAIISLAEKLVREIAWALAKLEDTCGFVGTGISAHGGIEGALTLLNDGSHAGSLQVLTGATFSATVLGDYEAALGLLPQFAAENDPAWYFSRAGYFAGPKRLIDNAGGNSNGDLAEGGPQLMFLGLPVRISQVLPSALVGTTGTMAGLVGDLSLAAAMGIRRDVTVETSREAYFAERMIGVLGTERFDIQVHDCGDASTAGPVVGLKFA